MRIALDYLPAVAHPPGVGRYARELVRALVQLPDRPELDLLEFGRDRPLWSAHELGLAAGDTRTRRVRVAWPRRLIDLFGALGRTADALATGSDLVHQVRLPPLSVSAAPQSIALAELPPEGTLADRALAALLVRGTGVFVFSTALERRVRARFELGPARVRRVLVGCEHWRRDLPTLPEPDRPARILVLGRRSEARAPRSTVRALELLRARGLEAELVWAEPAGHPARPDADERAFQSAVEASPARAAFQLRPPAGHGVTGPRQNEEALPGLVARSSVLLHLVPDAGTPVTPLEAALLGVPIVASRLPAFEEVFGSAQGLVRSGAVALCDHARAAGEPEFLADALARAIALRSDASARGALQAVARPFTWQACARAHVDAWRGWLAARA